jgi:anthranilate synthase/aminodeoxychorismate synthase-like glutamine amidotransferase
MILLIDNYDSFTYNLFQYLSQLGADVRVARNDRISIEEIENINPSAIVISPGPATPAKAGISERAVVHFCKTVPILGVCLGHQAIGEAFGANIVKAPTPMHGKTSYILHSHRSIFSSLPMPFLATRYHSLVIERNSLPDDLEVIAWTDDDIIMAVKHKVYPVVGVQFHPESIMTKNGLALLKNFVDGNI